MTRHQLRRLAPALAIAAAVLAVAPMEGLAEAPSPRLPTASEPAWPSSPYHGVLDGAGRVIPCRCRFRDRSFGLGEEVCMATPDGDRLARCDLVLNNTSWVPTATPCTVSLGSSAFRGRLAAGAAR